MKEERGKILSLSSFHTFQWSKIRMEKNRQHHHNRFIRLFKNAFTIFAFGLPVFFISIILSTWFKNPILPIDNLLGLLFILVVFLIISFLLVAYFYTDLEVDENGLLVEFMWKKLRIPWNKVLQIKPLLGIKLRKRGISVVIVDGLTPFHRLYGLIYGFSLKPAFILWPIVSNYEVLKNDIEKHIKQNRKTNL